MKLAYVGLTMVLICASFTANAEDAQKAPAASHDSVTKDSLAAMNEFVNILSEIKDEATAKSSKDKLTAVAKKLNEIKKVRDGLTQPGAEEIAKLKETYGPQMNDTMAKLAKETTRLAKMPEANKEVEDAMKEAN
jgi:hypothetical protein